MRTNYWQQQIKILYLNTVIRQNNIYRLPQLQQQYAHAQYILQECPQHSKFKKDTTVGLGNIKLQALQKGFFLNG